MEGNPLDERLNNLKLLSSMLLDIELMKLKKIASEQQKNSDALLEIRNTKTQQTGFLSSSDHLEACLRVGSYSKFDAWYIERTITLNQEKAILRAEMEKQQKKAYEMFGKSEVVSKLKL